MLSFGDHLGYGTHADYVFGWKGDALQRAMDSSCMFNACENGKPLKSQSVADMNKCAVKSQVKEDLDGCKWMLGLISRAWYGPTDISSRRARPPPRPRPHVDAVRKRDRLADGGGEEEERAMELCSDSQSDLSDLSVIRWTHRPHSLLPSRRVAGCVASYSFRSTTRLFVFM